MGKIEIRTVRWFVTFILLCGLAVSAQEDTGSDVQDGPLPQGPHVDLVYAKCQSCHNLKYVTDSAGLPAFLWEDTVKLMVQMGMQVTDAEEDQLLEYLTTYLGPDGPPENAQTESEPESANASRSSSDTGGGQNLDGEALYSSNCASCHQQTGQGIPGVFPPLAEHVPDLYKAEGGRDYLANLMLYGLQGEMMVNGETYNGVMPAWAQLSDAELAAILNHILTAWENEALLPDDFSAYAAEDLAAQRDQDLSAQDMLDQRPEVVGE